MMIIVDTREKQSVIEEILADFDRWGIEYMRSKLIVGDYMMYSNPFFSIDRKKGLEEIAGNLSGDHKRFKEEILRAKKLEMKLYVLIETRDDVHCLEDIVKWENPRKKRSPNCISGEKLFKTMRTIENKYNVEFGFCNPCDTSSRIVDLLIENEIK